MYENVPPPPAPAPRRDSKTTVIAVAVGVALVLIIGLLVANLVKASPAPAAAPTTTVAPTPSPSPSPTPSPTATIDPVVTDSPLDLALAKVHAGVYVIRFCNSIGELSGTLEHAMHFWSIVVGGSTDPNTVGRVWNDAVKKYDIPLQQLGTAFYRRYC